MTSLENEFQYLKSQYRLDHRDILILEKHLKEGKSKKEIAKDFNMTKERIRTLLINALNNAKEQFEHLRSDKYLYERANTTENFYRNI